MMTIFKKYFYTTIILRLNRNLITFLILNFAFLLFTACPEPPEDIDCGPHQIEVNGECECEEGYHWNEDHTKCLMDTTSHNFVWEIDTLGNYGSYLMDVAIIDENNVWVVGNIETDTMEYNAAHWDGSEWELVLIGVPGVIGEGIYYFAEDDIWIATGIIYHWNGEGWERYHLWDMGVLGPNDGGVMKIWGSNNNDIYFVGRRGSIVHYDGSGFERMESGTDADLKDIWGFTDEETGVNYVWTCGYYYTSNRSVVLSLIDGQWQIIYERYADGSNSLDDETVMSPKGETVWAYEDSDLLWVGGGFGLFTFNHNLFPTGYTEIKVYDETGYFAYPWKMRGNHTSDIFVAGEYGSTFHYNGNSWHWYSELQYDPVRFKSIDAAINMVVMVGTDFSEFLTKAIVVRGYR